MSDARSSSSDLHLVRDLIARTARTLVRTPVSLGAGGYVVVLVLSLALGAALAKSDLLQTLLAKGFPAPVPETRTFTLAQFFDTYCGGAGMTVMGLVAYAVGRARKNDALADAALVLGVAGLFGLGLTALGQFVLADTRPKDGGAMHFLALHGHGVSGHAAAASLLASPVRDVLLRRKSRFARDLGAAACVAWALLIGWSRIYLGAHHAWNVVLGLMTGLACARAATLASQGLMGSRSARGGA